MRFTALVLTALAALLALAAPAQAVTKADSGTRRALAAATARFSSSDELVLDRKGRLVHRSFGSNRPFVLQGSFVSTIDRRWARVIVATYQSDRVSTVLQKRNGRWQALASSGLSERRDAQQCKRSKIPRLAALDLMLGRNGSFDPARRCGGPRSARSHVMSDGQIGGLTETTTAEFPNGDDQGQCTDYYPGQPDIPREGYVSKSAPAWSFVTVYCTAGNDGFNALLGQFAAVMHGGALVDRPRISDVAPSSRCGPNGLPATMPLVARLELDICAVTDSQLRNLSR